MKFTYEYGIDTEIRRISFILEKVKSGFYQENNFLLLPYLLEGNPVTVFMPKLPQDLLKLLFDNVGSQLNRYQDSKYTLKEQFEGKSELVKELQKHLLSREEIEKVKQEWSKVEKGFVSVFETLFNVTDIDVQIRPTRFGTMSSNLFLDKSENRVAIYYRVDTDTSHLAEMILATFFGKFGVQGSKDLWQKREWAVDFMFKNSKLAGLFPGFTPTMDIVNKVHSDNKVLTDSWEYYKYLGYPMVNALTLRGESLLVNGELKDISNYPAALQNIVKLFVRAKNEMVTAEQVGECLWGDNAEAKFSLWAISKQIEGVRGMLHDIGVNPNVLETHRKKGYLLRG